MSAVSSWSREDNGRLIRYREAAAAPPSSKPILRARIGLDRSRLRQRSDLAAKMRTEAKQRLSERAKVSQGRFCNTAALVCFGTALAGAVYFKNQVIQSVLPVLGQVGSNSTANATALSAAAGQVATYMPPLVNTTANATASLAQTSLGYLATTSVVPYVAAAALTIIGLRVAMNYFKGS